VRPLVGISEPLTRALREWLPAQVTRSSSIAEVLDARPGQESVIFVDAAAIGELDRAANERGIPAAELALPGPVIAICDGPLQPAIGWLPARPWLSHVVSGAALTRATAHDHFKTVVSALATGGRARSLDWLDHTLTGRRIQLTSASQRGERLERMSEFFESGGVGAHAVELLRAATDELLTDAFYEAPLAAHAVKLPISRTLDVALPDDSGCELVYGCTDDLAMVRVRDPFGAVSRPTIVDGSSAWWRLVSTASFGALSVVAHHHADFLIAIAKHDAEPRPFAFHLAFKDGAKRRFWKLLRDDSIPPSSATFVTSVTTLGES